MSDLEQIIDGTEPEQEQTEAVEATEPEQEAPQEEATPEPEQAQEPEKQEEPMVPVAVVQELRKELRALREASQPKPQPTPAPDVFEDPQGYSKHMQAELRNATTQTKLEMSRFMAEREFGADQVNAMMEYYNQHPEQSQAFLNAPSPFHAAMEHYNSQRVAQEIGNDPAAYRAKLEAEIKAKLEAEMVAKQARDAAGKFAPSMANVTGTGGGPKSTWTGPTPITSVLGE